MTLYNVKFLKFLNEFCIIKLIKNRWKVVFYFFALAPLKVISRNLDFIKV